MEGGVAFQQRECLRKELVELRVEMKRINAQDQFATWAKLQRQFQKKCEALDNLQKHQKAQEQTGRLKWNIIWRCGYYVLLSCLCWKYRKTHMVYLPATWLQPFAWLLSYPDDLGVLSGWAWLAICRIALKNIFGILKM
jgi:hypothetical protein